MVGYAIFDSAIGRCAIAWSNAGVLGVRLPELREIDTRRLLLRQHPEARELRPPHNAEIAIQGMVSVLRGLDADLSEVVLNMKGIPPFNQRVYTFARTIPRGQVRTYDAVASNLRVPGATHSVALAIAKNPFMIIVPCHRLLGTGQHAERPSPYAGTITRRHLLSIEGASPAAGRTLFEVLLPVAPTRPHH
jgi:methylated-DNA-[protein]-cysteine S-methyltransferase